MKSEEVVVGEVQARLGIPGGTGRHQAIIVIGEEPTAANELNVSGDMLSGLGHVTLAFPLLEQIFEVAQFKRTIAAAIELLNDRPDVRHGSIAVWSFGAKCGAIAATIPGIAAAVILHLDGDADPMDEPSFDPHDVKCPVLLVFATARSDAANLIERIQKNLEGAGKVVEIQRYDAPAAQTSVTMQSFPAFVIADRWDHVQAFLRRHPS